MPLYEFQCSRCEHAFDKVLSLSELETEKIVCPRCGAGDVKRLISSGTVKVGLGGYRGKVG